jgi:hypothetical protein
LYANPAVICQDANPAMICQDANPAMICQDAASKMNPGDFQSSFPMKTVHVNMIYDQQI